MKKEKKLPLLLDNKIKMIRKPLLLVNSKIQILRMSTMLQKIITTIIKTITMIAKKTMPIKILMRLIIINHNKIT